MTAEDPLHAELVAGTERSPVAAEPLRRFLAAHAVDGVDELRPDGSHRRAVPTAKGGAVVELTFPAAYRVSAAVVAATPAALPPAVEAVRRWLGLDVDAAEADAALVRHAVLAPLVAARPGLRVPGAIAPAETALFTVLGQQVSLAAARTFAGRLVAGYGSPVAGGLRGLGSADAIAAEDPERLRAALGITGARSRALHALAAAIAGGLDLGTGADRAEARRALLALPGIGPWTADAIALRCLGDPDAFLPGDLVLRRALGGVPTAEAAAIGAAFSPHRAAALLHLWTAAVFADPPQTAL